MRAVTTAATSCTHQSITDPLQQVEHYIYNKTRHLCYIHTLQITAVHCVMISKRWHLEMCRLNIYPVPLVLVYMHAWFIDMDFWSNNDKD